MKLDEAEKILNNAGYLLETEDRGAEIGDFLKSFGFKHKPHNIFGLYKPIKRTPYEFFALFGMGNCNITVSYWDWDKNKRVVVDKIDVKYQRDDYFNWIITLKDNNAIIGSINASKYEEKYLILNYAIDNRYTNNGYMKEALKLVLDYLTNEVSIEKIYCGCCVENIKSKKVMEKYMDYVTTLKNHVILIDGLHDMHLYEYRKKLD